MVSSYVLVIFILSRMDCVVTERGVEVVVVQLYGGERGSEELRRVTRAKAAESKGDGHDGGVKTKEGIG
jgi:hypothetical protein